MVDNFSCNFNFYQNPQNENGNIRLDTDNCSSESFDAENIEVTDFEKHVINHKQNLEQRLRNLQSTMVSLRKQLDEEKSLWKKQLDEVIPQEVTTPCVFESNKFKEIADPCDLTDERRSLSTDLTISDYEAKLSRYEDALIKAHAEKREGLRRQISINNYKRRLLEVENMCNLELLRVKQSVQFLQPLQLMVSEWNLSNNNETMISDEEITGVYSQQKPKDRNKDYSDVSKTVEIMPTDTPVSSDNKLSKEKNILLHKTNSTSLTFPQISSTSTLWRVEDDLNQPIASANSAIWSSSECLTL